MTIGAVELPGVGFVLLPVHEYRRTGPLFRVDDPARGGSHLLIAADIRGSWSAWVRDLVGDEHVVEAPPPGVEIY